MTRGRAGIAVGMCLVFTFPLSLQSWGNARDLLYRQMKKSSVMCNITNCGGKDSDFANWLSLQCWAFCRDLLEEKSKHPLFPGARGLWLQMTSTLDNQSELGLNCFLLSCCQAARQQACIHVIS